VNLPRDKAIEAMDAINAAGYTAVIEAAVIPSHSREVLFRVTLPMLSADSEDMRTLCDLAESLGLTCRCQLQNFTFVLPDDYPKKRFR
jgi:predicted amidohydrolase YtcJ